MDKNGRYIEVKVLDSYGNITLQKIYDMKINFIATQEGIRYYKGNQIVLRPYWITRKDVKKMYELGQGVIEVIPYDIYNIRCKITKSRRKL